MSALKLSKKEPKPKKEKAPKVQKAPKTKSTKQKQPAAPKAPKVKVKVKADIYTLVLLLAWIALTAACILLYLDIKSYSM